MKCHSIWFAAAQACTATLLKIRTVVAANLRRLAMPFAQLFEDTHYAAATDAEVDLDGESVTSEVVDQH